MPEQKSRSTEILHGFTFIPITHNGSLDIGLFTQLFSNVDTYIPPPPPLGTKPALKFKITFWNRSIRK